MKTESVELRVKKKTEDKKSGDQGSFSIAHFKKGGGWNC